MIWLWACGFVWESSGKICGHKPVYYIIILFMHRRHLLRWCVRRSRRMTHYYYYYYYYITIRRQTNKMSRTGVCVCIAAVEVLYRRTRPTVEDPSAQTWCISDVKSEKFQLVVTSRRVSSYIYIYRHYIIRFIYPLRRGGGGGGGGRRVRSVYIIWRVVVSGGSVVAVGRVYDVAGPRRNALDRQTLYIT